MSNFPYPYPYQADARWAGLNSRGIALMLREESQAGLSTQMGNIAMEPQIVNPQYVFHDYEAVMARHAARYAPPIPEVSKPQNHPPKHSKKPKRDIDSLSDDEVFDEDFDNPLTVSVLHSTRSLQHPSSPNSRRQSTSSRNRSDAYPTPTTPRKSSRMDPTSSPLRPGTRRWAAFHDEEVLPPGVFPNRFKLVAKAQHRRRFSVTVEDLHTPVFGCPYIHPVTGEACRDDLRPMEVVWPMGESHWTKHVVKECRWMLNKALRVGHGNAIRSREAYDAYKKTMYICDVCGDGFSKATTVVKHKRLVHFVDESG